MGASHRGVLSDKDIHYELARGDLRVDPFDPYLLQPASLDVTLGARFRYLSTVRTVDSPHNKDIDPTDVTSYMDGPIVTTLKFRLRPGAAILGTTVENLILPNYIAGRIEGKSSLARLGLIVHITAGYIDPGWQGPLTLELVNFNTFPIVLTAGMPIGQLSFAYLDTPTVNPYSGQYTNQDSPTGSRYWVSYAKYREHLRLRQKRLAEASRSTSDIRSPDCEQSPS